jgi:uncharacterized protein (TIGR03435 family)
VAPVGGNFEAEPVSNSRVRTAGLVAAIALSVTVLVAAQSASEFEVASIKRNESGEGGSSFDMSRGRIRATNTLLQPLIRQAFEVMDTQVVGAPSWMATERYDIVAKAPAGVTSAADMRPLLRALLAERFKLATHRETRDMPVFALVRARADGFGPGFRAGTVDDCAAQAPAAPPLSAQDEWPACVVRFTPGRLYIGGYDMAEVLRMLTPLVGRTILDETGIAGRVHVRLEYQPQGPGAQPPNPPADDRRDLFTALEEQVGIKLESRRAPVNVLAIDALEKPTAD